MKNLATWLLAAAFTTAALPAFAVEPSVQVGYSPEGSARVLVLSAIDSAKTSIRMMAYSFTAPDIMKALVSQTCLRDFIPQTPIIASRRF